MQEERTQTNVLCIEELLRTAKGEILIGKNLLRAQFQKAYDIVKLWHEWGIPMKYKRKWEFAGHSYPGRRTAADQGGQSLFFKFLMPLGKQQLIAFDKTDGFRFSFEEILLRRFGFHFHFEPAFR